MMTSEKCRPWLPTPAPLVNLAGNIVDDRSLPACWNWETHDVLKWLRTIIGLPQYRECFSKNYIDGRRLLLVDATVCTQIGIHDFEHIQCITRGIRRLYCVEKVRSDRSISLPPNLPWTHYLLYRVPTGPKRENIPPTKLFRMMGILDSKKSCITHWDNMLPASSKFPYNRFGSSEISTRCVNSLAERECLCHINDNDNNDDDNDEN